MSGTRSYATALAVVALMLVCPFLAMAGSVDADSSERFVMHMRAGDTFVYEPETNLPSVFTVDASEGSAWDAEAGKLTASFDDVDVTGDLKDVITAVWTSEDGNVVQHAVQEIVYMVYGHVRIDGSVESETTVGITGGMKAGDVVYRQDIPEATAGTVTAVSTDIRNDHPYLMWDDSQGAVVLKADIPMDAPSQLFEVCISAVNAATDPGCTLMPETASVDVTVVLSQDLVITSGDSFRISAAESTDGDNTYTVTTNYDGSDVVEVDSVTFDTSGLPEGIVKAIDGSSIVFDPFEVDFGDSDSVTLGFVVEVRGTDANGEPVSVSKTVELTVLRDAGAGKAPIAEDIRIEKDDSDPMRLSVVVEGATMLRQISVVWGDGSSPYVQDGISMTDVGTYTIEHAYAEAGDYTLSLELRNEFGTNTVYFLYDAESGEWNFVDGPPASDGSWSGTLADNWMSIVFALLAVALLLVFLLAVREPIVVVCSGVSAILAVVTYLL